MAEVATAVMEAEDVAVVAVEWAAVVVVAVVVRNRASPRSYIGQSNVTLTLQVSHLPTLPHLAVVDFRRTNSLFLSFTAKIAAS